MGGDFDENQKVRLVSTDQRSEPVYPCYPMVCIRLHTYIVIRVTYARHLNNRHL